MTRHLTGTAVVLVVLTAGCSTPTQPTPPTPIRITAAPDVLIVGESFTVTAICIDTLQTVDVQQPV